MPRKHDKHLQRRLLEQRPGALNQSRGFKSLLFQDRDLAYSAISELESLNTAHSAFSILSQTMFNLNETQERQGPPTQRPSKLETDFEWAYIGLENPDGVGHPDVDLAHCKKSPLRLRTM